MHNFRNCAFFFGKKKDFRHSRSIQVVGKNKGDKKMTTNDIIWLAGLVDGEGSTFLSRQEAGGKFYFQPTFSISMVHYPTIKRVQQVISFILNEKEKKIYHSTFDNSPNRDCYSIKCSGEDCLLVLKAIQQYTITKKEEIDVMIHHIENAKKISSLSGDDYQNEVALREKTYYRLKKLKQINWTREVVDFYELYHSERTTQKNK